MRLRGIPSGEILLFTLGKENDDNPHEAGVEIMLSKKASRSPIEWEPVSNRIVTAKLDSHYHKTTVIQCYAPSNDPSENEKQTFYEVLQATRDKAPRSDMIIVLGDMIAKVGEDNDECWEYQYIGLK